MALRLANGAQGAMDRDAPGAFARQADCCGDRPAEECSRWVARIDAALASTWLYPTNYPVRAYQESIVKQCLLKNTLVCLPTGLGKTLIAAVLMYNYHRWFPEGQIIFMAPTRPLVGQQVAACHGVVGLPEGDTAEINGTVDQRRRRQLWAQRRVFYCTPQTVQNDLENGALDCSRVVLVVVDEAHRALKKYAYCGVVRAIAKRQSHFRVLSLSATPGSDIAGVQAVIDNLRIAHVEARLVEKVTCEPAEGAARHLAEAAAALQTIAGPPLGRLKAARLLHSSDLAQLSAFQVFSAECSHSGLFFDKLLAHKLVAAHDALKAYGPGGCLDKLEALAACDANSDKPFDKVCARVAAGAPFKRAVDVLRGAGEAPKTAKLRELLVDHFARSREAGRSSRAMVFTGTRHSVDAIGDALAGEPGLRVQRFVGQGGASGMKQDDQKAAVKRFLADDTNVLVATCIAEEGLDIGAVDMCVFYDQVGSPIRLVQRMGRTARKRAGRVVLLMGPGEDRKFEAGGEKSARVNAALRDLRGLRLHQNLNKRMVPRRLVPNWPDRVDRELAIGAYHASQVGGNSAKAKRKRAKFNPAAEYKGDASWRDYPRSTKYGAPLTYKPRLADAWRRNVKRGTANRPPPPAGGAAPEPSLGARALRDVADFVALEGYADLYDPDALDEHIGAYPSVAFQEPLAAAKARKKRRRPTLQRTRRRRGGADPGASTTARARAAAAARGAGAAATARAGRAAAGRGRRRRRRARTPPAAAGGAGGDAAPRAAGAAPRAAAARAVAGGRALGLVAGGAGAASASAVGFVSAPALARRRSGARAAGPPPTATPRRGPPVPPLKRGPPRPALVSRPSRRRRAAGRRAAAADAPRPSYAAAVAPPRPTPPPGRRAGRCRRGRRAAAGDAAEARRRAAAGDAAEARRGAAARRGDGGDGRAASGRTGRAAARAAPRRRTRGV
ncbi:helicase [Aureococcus anophagefferens]|nr:helicase [Aureococcus anophagefferens]